MDFISMDKETVKKILYRLDGQYNCGDSHDLMDICDMFCDLMKAEADAIEKKEPYAVKTISALREAATYLSHMANDLFDISEER